ncbi:ChbG/HpnK family deacetylase [Clostridium chrysemydis]|uniref:ChbG/HpnK family deacetylase n=1 Tax=Clostridium chrysemydis TaxID=2665504 RepID=UPI001883DB94|nr:ChbG/HpnK family deacetylase [Clostridium chrysemydis]
MLNKNIIINASDFGLSNAVNYGIIDSFKNGVVTSTEIICTTPGFEHAVNLALENPDLDIGVHFSLTLGEPICKDYKHILAPTGTMKQDYEYLATIPVKIIKAELEAQLKKILESGIKPTHITFHHTPCIIPEILNLASQISLKTGMVLRAYAERELKSKFLKKYIYKNSFDIDFFSDKIETFDDFKRVFKEHIHKNNIEINCQPGYIDSFLLKSSCYTFGRLNELDILCSNEIKELISINGYKLLNYREY